MHTLNDDIGKMYTSGQIKLEIHPVIFLDKCSSDHYSARVSGSIAYISEKIQSMSLHSFQKYLMKSSSLQK